LLVYSSLQLYFILFIHELDKQVGVSLDI